MQVVIVGTGKLASELLASHQLGHPFQVVPWGRQAEGERAIVVHAGSGRELEAVADFCRATASPLIELSTGSALEREAPEFPVVLCPNTNILMLKFMAMLEASGHLFRGYQVELLESHQASKSSVPGTAVAMAASLGLAPGAIRSVRDPLVQQGELGIATADLPRHAFHRIRIDDGVCQVQLETRVQGDTPYAAGVSRIVEAVAGHALENRLYPVMELVQAGWL
ncbi:dihydrodipicolinate reductase C-terminal domain-containing protein [Azospira sp. I13]|uniref:dihydrodipicolinate reductase C-terminal domain-containing protein n=1 Tax=Azospira sp. I13 TaxID=1765050 RepID=UPI000D5A0D63|nr:dihydrodipicolinate reductase C-terminal domain-containing protein [Azospira sp. I13]